MHHLNRKKHKQFFTERIHIKKSKLAPIAAPASILLGIIGIITGIYIIGGILGVIGWIFGLIGYNDSGNPWLACIGVILSAIAVACTCIFYTLWDVVP